MATHHNSLLEPVPAGARRQIEAILQDVLRSIPFRTSRQCQDLFRYIVEHSLAGSDESLRERVIGIEVFGRPADYDTAEDPVVRLRAADVRKRLAQYYQAQKSEPEHWKIDIPTGSYKAQFHPSEVVPPSRPGSATVIAPVETVPPNGETSMVSSAPRGKRTLFWVSALLSGCIAVALAVLMLNRTSSPV